jgi:dihydroorotase
LTLTHETAETMGTLAKVNPPLRPRKDVDACVEGLADGTIDLVVTDHAPHTLEDKGKDLESAAYGMVGLETAVGLLLELVEKGAISRMRMIDAMSTAAARIFKLPGGTLAPGAVADVTIIDPAKPYKVNPEKFLSKSRNTPFAGRTLPGRAVRTVVGGRTSWGRS